jgi:hypothetical protein
MCHSKLPSRVNDWEAFFPPGASVVALPSWKRPRLLLLADTFGERISGSGFYPAFRLTGRLYRLVLRLKAVLAVGALRSDPEAPAFLCDFLNSALPGARVRAIHIGMPGRARKLTLQLVCPGGGVLAYLKCADTPAAQERLKHEHQVLCTLPEGRGPTVLRYDSVGDYNVLLLGAVAGQTLRPNLAPTPELMDFTNSLLGTDSYDLEAHPWVRSQFQLPPQLVETLEALSGRRWQVAVQHGDLAPWNLIRAPDGGLTGIDWEYGLQAGFPGLDLAQYMLQVAVLIHRWPPRRAREYAVHQLLRDEHLPLRKDEASTIVALAAYQAYENTSSEGHPPGSHIQVWRRAIWEGG